MAARSLEMVAVFVTLVPAAAEVTSAMNVAVTMFRLREGAEMAGHDPGRRRARIGRRDELEPGRERVGDDAAGRPQPDGGAAALADRDVVGSGQRVGDESPRRSPSAARRTSRTRGSRRSQRRRSRSAELPVVSGSARRASKRSPCWWGRSCSRRDPHGHVQVDGRGLPAVTVPIVQVDGAGRAGRGGTASGGERAAGGR